MPLTSKQKSYLRALAHHRRVIVTVGNAGPTDAVIAEINQALSRHELLKIRLPAIHRDQRAEMLTKLGESLNAELIQSLGRIGVFYRRADKPTITLPT